MSQGRTRREYKWYLYTEEPPPKSTRYRWAAAQEREMEISESSSSDGDSETQSLSSHPQEEFVTSRDQDNWGDDEAIIQEIHEDDDEEREAEELECSSNDGGSETLSLSSHPQEEEHLMFGNQEVREDNGAIIQEHVEEEDQRPLLNDTLCGCTNTTEGEALVMCLALGFRHSLSWTAMVDMTSMINVLFGKRVVLSSKYFFKKFMSVQNNNATYHLYCPHCERYLGKKEDLTPHEACRCGHEIQDNESHTFFMSLGLEAQLKNLLGDSKFLAGLNWRFERKKCDEDSLEDIYDGAGYSDYFKPGELLWERYNMSYTFNTDGVPLGRSSKQTMWPIYVTINELPPSMRSKYMLLSGIYVGKKHPNMKIFLHPFVEEANAMSTAGVTWYLKGREMNSKVIPLCASVDSVARCQMLNMSQFNGHYGCTLCYQKSEHTSRGMRYPVIANEVMDRTHDSILKDAAIAYARRREGKEKCIEKGVKGPTPLHNMLYFNLSDGMVPDYMHSVLLGNIRYHTDLLMKSFGKEYCIGLEHKISVIDSRLKSIRPPSSITRTPRGLTEMNLWKASEWRSWLIFYSLVCLDGVIPKRYIQHLSMLSSAICILLQKSISTSDLSHAHQLLLRYVFLFQKYFGKAEMVYNIHLLTHLCNGVANWGPLWTHNAFSFEGQNRKLLQLHKSPANVSQQVVTKFNTFKALPSLCRRYSASDDVIDFCEALSSRSLKQFYRSDGTVLMGRGSHYILNDEEKNCLIEFDVVDHEVLSFSKIILGGVRYTSSGYTRAKKTNDSIVWLTQEVIGKIEKICLIRLGNEKSVLLFVRVFEVEGNPVLEDEFVDMRHVLLLKGEGVLMAIKPNMIAGQCISMHLNNGNFICKVPYGCYGD